jgi:hypothetical protein
MPLSLDFPEISDAFRQFLLLPVRPIAHSFERLAAWLRQRVKAGDQLELSSRDFPVIRFYDDAVMLWLDPIQRGALAPDNPPARFGDQLSRAGQKFLEGIGRIKGAIEEELIIPSVFGSLAQAVDAIAASVERFSHPPTEMAQQLFADPLTDRSARTAIDLFGEAALAWRSIAGSTSQLKGFAGHIGKAFNLPGSGAGAGGETKDVHELPDKLDTFSRLILAGLLLLPALPAFAASIWQALVISIKFGLVDAAARIEATVHGLRRKVIDFFYVDIRSLLRTALSTTLAAGQVLTVNIRFFTEFALDYGALLISQLRTFFDELKKYFDHYINLVNGILEAINAVLKFDVGPLIALAVSAAFGPAVAAAAMAATPEITIDDLITAGTDLERAVTRAELTTLAATVNGLVQMSPLPLPSAVRTRAAAVPELVWNLLRPPRRYPRETGKVVWPAGYGFPNLYETIFAPGLPGLRKAIGDLSTELPEGARNILGAGQAALDVLADEFATQADQAAAMGSPERFRRLAETADRQAQAVFGTDAEELRRRIAERPSDAVAQAFENWLAVSGFEVVAAAIPIYLREMRAFWREKEAHGEEATVRIDMTSPHILAEKAKLARTTMKQLVIEARGQKPGADLAEEVAATFQSAVHDAYGAGERRLKTLATLAGTWPQLNRTM